MTDEKEITHLVSSLYSYIQKYGVSRVISKINELNKPQHEKKLFDFIVTSVCLTYNVDIEDLKKSYLTNTEGKKVIEARNMCFVLIKKFLNYSHQDIAARFGKTHAMVSNAIKEFSLMDGVIKPEKEYLDNYNKISNRVENFKSQLN